MNRQGIHRNDAGFTLIELTFTAGIMTVGLVMMMGTVINLSHQSASTELAIAASHFNTSVLESLRGLDEEEVLQFNEDESEFDVNEAGKVHLENLGDVKFEMWCVVKDGNGTVSRLSIPMTDDAMEAMATIPNPMEVQVQVSLDKGRGSGNEFKYMTSALIYH